MSSFNSKLRRPLFKSGGELSHRFVFYASSMIVSMSVSVLMSMSVLVSVALSDVGAGVCGSVGVDVGAGVCGSVGVGARVDVGAGVCGSVGVS